MLLRLEDAGIMGAGQETLHQRYASGLLGKTWTSGGVEALDPTLQSVGVVHALYAVVADFGAGQWGA